MVKDPEDSKSCILNPCDGFPKNLNCKINFEYETCECPPADDQRKDVDGSYGEWTEWSECPFNCRLGRLALPVRQTRRRPCLQPKGKGESCFSLGPDIEERSCGQKVCPVGPSWTEWAPWESCSSICPEHGRGTQQRQRICEDDGLTKESCNTLSGQSIETRECDPPPELTSACQNMKLGQWSEWSSCSVPCISLVPEAREVPLQSRSRSCSGAEVCKYLTKDGRICPNLPSCQASSCHADWWKATREGPYHYGCTDTDGSGTYWCPKSGGTDENMVALPSAKHVCSQEEIDLSQFVSLTDTDTREKREAVPLCKKQRELEKCRSLLPEDPDYDICQVILELYDEEKNEKHVVPLTESLNLIKTLIMIVKWNPLTTDEESYISPFVKYMFYEDAKDKLGRI